MIDIKQTEDCRILTDRWGEILDLDQPATYAQRSLVACLLPSTWDEITFVAERNNIPGILFEVELDEGASAEAEVPAAEEIAAAFPEAEVWITEGPHIFEGRAAMRAFVSVDRCSAALSERIGQMMLKLT